MKPILIAVAGGSGSGKTTVVNKIRKAFKEYDVLVIRHDDYYKKSDEESLEKRMMVNYDHPISLDNSLLLEHLKKLINGEEVDKPIYDFVNHQRSEKVERIKPAKIIILEGILILEDEKIRKLLDIKIYVDTDDDLRFIRRLRRDINERGRTLDNVINQYLRTVKPMYHAFVKPTKRYADLIIPNDYSHDVAVDLINVKINSIVNKENML